MTSSSAAGLFLSPTAQEMGQLVAARLVVCLATTNKSRPKDTTSLPPGCHTEPNEPRSMRDAMEEASPRWGTRTGSLVSGAQVPRQMGGRDW